MTLEKELWREIAKIRVTLSRLKKRLGVQFEFVFIGAYYDTKGNYKKGFELMDILTLSNYDGYIKMLQLQYQRHHERERFLNLSHLGEFLVKCINDNISEDNRKHFEREGGDWPVNGKVYVVTKVNQSIDGLCLQLRERDGKPLKCPEPYEGYHSIRFQVEDYTKLN